MKLLIEGMEDDLEHSVESNNATGVVDEPADSNIFQGDSDNGN